MSEAEARPAGGFAGWVGSGRRATATAFVGGALWGLCFERLALPWLAWFALVPLCALFEARRTAWLGWFAGTVSWCFGLRWIPATLDVYGELSGALSWSLLLPLGLYLGGYFGLFGLLGGVLWRAGGVKRGLGLPALWVALEWLRTFLFSGFPWNLAAYAWVDQPGALGLAPWIGAYGVSAIVVAVNVALATAVERRSWEGAAVAVLVPLLGLSLVARSTVEPVRGEGVGLPIAVVQPNTPNQVGWDPQIALADYQRLIRLSEAVCDGSKRLLLWPESAAFPFSYERDPRLREDLGRLVARGCTVVLNSPAWRGDAVYNSVLLVDGKAEPSRYDKRHLVPFGEYVPLATVFTFIDGLARNAGSFTPGTEVAPLPASGFEIGAALCYEVVFPGEVADQVQAGADLLVTLTNDAWYGNTAAPWQHFRAAQFRAAENRRWMVRAAITGVSGTIDPHGRVVDLLGVGELGTISGVVEPLDGTTWFTRAPSAVPWTATLFALFAIFRSRRRRV